MTATSESNVWRDVMSLRADLRDLGIPYRHLFGLTIWRPLRDMVLDCGVVLAAVAMLVHGGWLFLPLVLLCIGNRQRALGNILHDAGHSNLHRTRAANDGIAKFFLAPLLFVDLATYRHLHFKHHHDLGHAQRDPDYIPLPAGRPVLWVENYLSHAICIKVWLGSVAGHLAHRDTPAIRRAYIVGWWLVLAVLFAAVAGVDCTVMFLIAWIAARATVFHLITVFREMCDHFGLQPGGVISFTRDIVVRGVGAHLIHPHNNGYHLTHHLLPTIPYYLLPAAQRVIAALPIYQQGAVVISSYLGGGTPVVSSWNTGGRA